MGRKIFVSYKYGDSDVLPLKEGIMELIEPTTARHYVDELQGLLEGEDHINKGEADGEDLSNFRDSTIESKLRHKIYNSSITIVVISPNMKELYKSESDQWIPWEIAYSLKEHTRGGKTSLTNAVLAVVLPDKNGSYNYFSENYKCCAEGCQVQKTHMLFQILRDNMFNTNIPTYMDCNSDRIIYKGYPSYIHAVKWVDLNENVNTYIDIALHINSKADNYRIVKTVN